MGGTSGSSDYTIQQASLMSDQQRKFLDEMLGGVRGQISGFKVGEPYKGPGLGNYSPKAFTFPNVTPSYNYTPDWSGRGRNSGDGGSRDDGKRGGDDSDDSRGGRDDGDRGGRRRRGDDTGVRNMGPSPSSAILRLLAAGVPGASGMPAASPSAPSWASFLRANPMNPVPTKSLSELMTRPMISPFTQGLTGNIPRS